MGFSFFRTGTLSLVVLAFLASGAARAGEFLHMPFACRYDGIRVHLVPSDDRAYRVIGPREREIYTACAPSNASRCRSWFVHRFDLDCDGARVSWLDVAEAAARKGGRDAWVEDGRFSMRMGRFWSVARDDGPEFTRGRWRRAFDDFGPGFDDGPRARRVVTLPPGFAPALGVAIAFSGGAEGAREAAMDEPLAPLAASGSTGAPEDFAEEPDYVEQGPAGPVPEVDARAAAAPPPAAPMPAAPAEVAEAAAPPVPHPIPELPQRAPPRPQASPAPPPVETAAVPGASAPAPVAEQQPKTKVTVVKPEPPPTAAAPQVSANAPVATTVPGTIKPVIINAPPVAVADPAPAPAAPATPAQPSAAARVETHSEAALTPPEPQPASPTTTSSMQTAASDLPPQPEPASAPAASGPRVGDIEISVATLAASAALLVLAALGAYGFWRWSQEDGLPDPPTERDIASVSFGGSPRPGRQLVGIEPALAPARSEPPAVSEHDLPVPTTYEQALEALGVNADATIEAIKKIVDGLRRSWHPDHARSEADRAYREKRLRQINVAWDLVSQQRSAA